MPTFRPDRALAAENPADFNAYLDTLGEKAGFEIDDYDTFIEALEKRHAFFHDNGCRSSDHALVSPIAENFTLSEVKSIFTKVRNETPLDASERLKLRTAALLELGKMNFKRTWVMQLHIGSIRNNNSLMFERLGPDTGFDSMGDRPYAQELVKFLDILNSDKSLPKTMVYNLNPRDYEMIMSIIGSFQAGTIPGKIQLGSAWWFNDQKNGMELLGKMVRRISYTNAKDYFSI